MNTLDYRKNICLWKTKDKHGNKYEKFDKQNILRNINNDVTKQM